MKRAGGGRIYSAGWPGACKRAAALCQSVGARRLYYAVYHGIFFLCRRSRIYSILYFKRR
jgi:hypothetical protein